MITETIPQAKAATGSRLLFFDFVRNVAMLSVILYHAAAAYSTMTPWWSTHDGTSVLADFIRQYFDVYIMPVFFFVAGYFTLSSLQKKGLGLFIADKFKRLGIPWLVVMLTIVPLSVYSLQLKTPIGETVHGFLNYFITGYLGSFGTLRLGNVPPGQITQMHLWYISLLIAFFLVFGLAYQLINRFHRASNKTVVIKPAAGQTTGASIIKTLLLIAVLSTALSFAVMLFIPDMSWFTLDLLLQFQPTKVFVYALVFCMGIYAYNRKWFSNATFFNRPYTWAAAGILLTVGYLLCGKSVFVHAGDSQTLSPILLLAYTAIRSFLCPTILITLLSLAHRYMNRPVDLNQKLAVNSFNIYLVHFFFVIFLQEFLMLWAGGPALAKIGIILIITLPASYGLSRLINRFPRGFAIGLAGLTLLAFIGIR